MNTFSSRVVACSVTVMVALGTTVLAAPSAQALSPGLAFSAESLSTWQTNGVAFATASSGGKVVVGGEFTQLTPPDTAPGSPIDTPALAILDADTGAPTDCQIPVTLPGGSPKVYALTTSPDGGTVYVGGNFSQVGGQSHNRFAAIDVSTCTVLDLTVPGISSFVYGIASSADTVYLAGSFTTVAGQPRANFAAVDKTTGALRPWVADTDKRGRAIAVSPDGTKVAIGGDFFAVNGAYSHSIAVVNATTGANLKTYPAGSIDDKSVTKTIVSDPATNSFYTGNEGDGSYIFDGRTRVDWNTMNEKWRDTCLGATQAVLPYQGILYSASHSHECTTMGLYQNGSRKFFTAETLDNATHRGWTPLANDGIGEGIGPRALAVATGTSGAKYLYAVGEFTQINGKPQLGITRFGTKDTGAPPAPAIQAEALASKAVQVRIATVVDNDDQTLTYNVYRDGASKPLWTGKATSWWWSRPQIVFTDKTASLNTTHKYRVTASDGTNTSPLSGEASAKPVSKSLSYPAQVIADGAALYWRYDETSGQWIWDKGKDSSSGLNGLLNSGVGLKAEGALSGNTGASFDGVNDSVWSDQLRTAPTTYTVETWIKTTTTRGGKIIGYTDNRPRTDNGAPLWATIYDRHVYMDDGGRLNFGVYPKKTVVLRSPAAYNDGKWHHIVASQGTSGMRLKVDGITVATNGEKNAQAYAGVWKVGGDTMGAWPNRPTSEFFAGQIDETAVYEGKVLSDAAIVKHYELSGRKVKGNTIPKDAYGAAVYASNPQIYWRLDESKGDVKDRSLSGSHPGKVGSKIKRRAGGEVGKAIGTAGKSGSLVATKAKVSSPKSFTVETWVKTTSKKGGKVVGFENSQKGTGTAFDKQLYLTNDGTAVFGVRPSAPVTLKSTKGLNNGKWHHLVGTQNASGLSLYVDGKRVATNAGTTTNQQFSGYWRVGGGNLAGWPSRPSSGYLAGTIDDTAVYTYALSSADVTKHYDRR